jgi:hypothetical protein
MEREGTLAAYINSSDSSQPQNSRDAQPELYLDYTGITKTIKYTLGRTHQERQAI